MSPVALGRFPETAAPGSLLRPRGLTTIERPSSPSTAAQSGFGDAGFAAMTAAHGAAGRAAAPVPQPSVGGVAASS